MNRARPHLTAQDEALIEQILSATSEPMTVIRTPRLPYAVIQPRPATERQFVEVEKGVIYLRGKNHGRVGTVHEAAALLDA